MIYLTSDLHFNHENILRYEPESRPFTSIKEMNETLIRNWNNVVKVTDTLYVLGDFFMGQLQDIEPILSRLNGTIKLVRGNHDTKARIDYYKSQGIEVKDIDYIMYKGRFFILCHFPIANEEFINMVRNDNSEVIVCYGHIHHNAPVGYVDGTYHIGVDTNNLTPISIQQIWEESWPKAEEDKEVMEYKIIHSNDPIEKE